MKSSNINIILTGVGGQGIITMATLIAESALEARLNAIVAETHGLSQRGGTVIVHVRIGKSIRAPLVPKGGADLMIALEPLEALRYLDYMKKKSTIILNTYLIPPPLPGIQLPEIKEIIEKLKKLEPSGLQIYPINATEKAIELGDARVANTYLVGYALGLGVFEGFIGIEDVEKAISRIGKLVDKNLEALHAGYIDGYKNKNKV